MWSERAGRQVLTQGFGRLVDEVLTHLRCEKRANGGWHLCTQQPEKCRRSHHDEPLVPILQPRLIQRLRDPLREASRLHLARIALASCRMTPHGPAPGAGSRRMIEDTAGSVGR